MMASMATIMGLGLLFYILLGDHVMYMLKAQMSWVLRAFIHPEPAGSSTSSTLASLRDVVKRFRV